MRVMQRICYVLKRDWEFETFSHEHILVVFGLPSTTSRRIPDVRKYLWHPRKRWWNGWNRHFRDMESNFLSHDWGISLIQFSLFCFKRSQRTESLLIFIRCWFAPQRLTLWDWSSPSAAHCGAAALMLPTQNSVDLMGQLVWNARVAGRIWIHF